MPTVKPLVGIAIAIAMAFAGATALGISAVEHSPPRPPTNHHVKPSKADFRLNDHQRLRHLLGIERPLR
jgi:hypothetical protein